MASRDLGVCVLQHRVGLRRRTLGSELDRAVVAKMEPCQKRKGQQIIQRRQRSPLAFDGRKLKKKQNKKKKYVTKMTSQIRSDVKNEERCKNGGVENGFLSYVYSILVFVLYYPHMTEKASLLSGRRKGRRKKMKKLSLHNILPFPGLPCRRPSSVVRRPSSVVSPRKK